ncbi:MAG: hypothetical protein O4805_15350, partial [Trichodesmium sp. St16_bin2-tuft]|nr:hypothetical protein [Trichodesmium sp. St16_bin2-tuft]
SNDNSCIFLYYMPEVPNVGYKYKYLLNFPSLSVLHFVVRNVGYRVKFFNFPSRQEIQILHHKRDDRSRPLVTRHSATVGRNTITKIFSLFYLVESF